jgi:transposase
LLGDVENVGCRSSGGSRDWRRDTVGCTRNCDFALYAERNLIERFFNFIKQFRGIAGRYEKNRSQLPRRPGSAPSLGLNEDTP